MTCPLLYRFRTIDQLPEPPSIDAVRGNLVHSVLERLFDHPATSRSADAAYVLVDHEWKALIADQSHLSELFGADEEAEQEFLSSARRLVDKYFSLEDPTRIEPSSRELHVETLLESGLTLHGYIDRLDRSPAGDIRIIDYKTGRAPSAGWEGKAFFQMRFYGLIVWRTEGVLPRLLQLMYLGNETILRHEPDAADLEATERKIEAIWSAIKTAHATGSWLPKKSALCGWCNHQSICPEFGGTPPPLPLFTELKVGPALTHDGP
jgi:putative RecB family exonuclease